MSCGTPYTQVDDILPAIGEALKTDVPADSAMSRSCQRMDALQYIRSTVGDAVYWGRRVEPKGASAISLRMISTQPVYDLVGEVSTIPVVVDLSVFTKGTMPIICSRIINAARLALSGYRGTLWGYSQERAYIHGATIIREQSDPAQLPAEAGGYWAFAASFDLQVTFSRTVTRGDS